MLGTRLRLLAPFVPFMTNELHERLTGDPVDDWPEADPDLESEAIEARERLVERLTADVGDILDVTGTDPETIRVYVAADCKREVLEQVVETGPDVGRVMGEVMSDPDLRERGDEVNRLVQDLVEVVRERDESDLRAMLDVDEAATYGDASEFLAREFDAEVEVYAEDDPDVEDPGERAGNAQPLRPAVHVE